MATSERDRTADATAANNDDRLVVIRPTEAQLRWAQFHHKRRAQNVKAKVDRLWQSPASMDDVDGALPEDGDDTSASESEEANDAERRKRRPYISKGRRAMLRVSRRALYHRQELIAEHGYRMQQDFDGGEVAGSEASDQGENDHDLAGEVFSPDSRMHRRRRRRQQQGQERQERPANSRLRGIGKLSEKERLERFEAACHAMMMNLSGPSPVSIEAPTKRWTRTDAHIAASDDHDFENVKWGALRLRRMNRNAAAAGENGHAPNGNADLMPLDRGASWMVHLPGKVSNVRQCPYYYNHPDFVEEDKLSEAGAEDDDDRGSLIGRSQFNHLVALVQNQVIARATKEAYSDVGAPPLMMLKDSSEMNYDSVDEEKYGDEHSESGTQLPDQPTTAPRRKTHRLAQQFLDRQENIAKSRRNQTQRPVGKLSSGGGMNFESAQEEKKCPSEEEGTISVSCAVCGIKAQDRSNPLGSAPSTADFFARVRQLGSDDSHFVEEDLCQECYCREFANEEFGDDEEELDDDNFKVTNSSPPPQMRLSDDWRKEVSEDAASGPEEKKKPRDTNPSLFDNDDTASDYSTGSSLSSLFKRGRTSLNDALTSTLNSIPEMEGQNDMSKRHSMGALPTTPQSTADLKARAASMSGRVGGFFSKISGQTQTQTQQPQVIEGQHLREVTPSQDEDEHLALSAFRKKQESSRTPAAIDDSSSVSSFRVLPPGIRGVVKNLYQSQQQDGAVGAQDDESSIAPHSSASRSIMDRITPSKFKQVQQSIFGSPSSGDVIDTDGASSEGQGAGMDLRKVAGLSLSPAVLNKRLQQAIRAIENCNWDQVSYLVTANPWLAEMSEITTDQYLLHKLAFYGSGPHPAPNQLNHMLVQLFPAVVHKFDQDGNLPLHLAAAAGNLGMIELLGAKFRSGASVRNEDGMLPLHFAIATRDISDIEEYTNQSLNEEARNSGDDGVNAYDIIRTVLRFFPKAVAIADNDGNLPIHIASACLEGPLGVDIVYLLLDEADRQLQDPYGARFHNNIKAGDLDDTASESTMATDYESSCTLGDNVTHCNMVRNDMNETPLMSAILSRSGWAMIEAIVSGPGGRRAALSQDAYLNNPLHLLFSADYLDAAAAMSILKVAPETAAMRNCRGMLPIESACMQSAPEEVILALVLFDLPVDIDDTEACALRKGCGGSWWFLACECEDYYADVVSEIVSLCTYEQVEALSSFSVSRDVDALLTYATPQTRYILNQALGHEERYFEC